MFEIFQLWSPVSKGGLLAILNHKFSSNLEDLFNFKNEFPIHSFVQNLGCSQTFKTKFGFTCFGLQVEVRDFSLDFVLSKLFSE